MHDFNWFDCEDAIRLLVWSLQKEQKKPVLYHSLRVGALLFYYGYDYETQIAWILHDILEDSDVTEWLISEKFGQNVASIVKANSKNNSLPKPEILEDIVKRCHEYGKFALVVKMADVYDNFRFYVRAENESEIDRCKFLANLIIQYRDPSWNDKIFELANTVMAYKGWDSIDFDIPIIEIKNH